MSLYKFIESSINNNPDLAEINYTNAINYDRYYNFYRIKEKRYDIEAFLNPLFYDKLIRCSGTIKEYEQLKFKVRNIAQISQKLFDLSLLNDKMEKEKIGNLLKQQNKN